MTPSSPSAKDMGPIERELRAVGDEMIRIGLRDRVWFVNYFWYDLSDAARPLLANGEWGNLTVDTWSDAIEYCSELGL